MTHQESSTLLMTAFVLALLDVSAPTRAAALADGGSRQALTAVEATGTYSVDPLHTHVGFRVRHMGLATILGAFKDYTATIYYDANDITKSSVRFTARVASLDTGVEQRDDHLRSADFFEVEKYPEMTFGSVRIERKSGSRIIAHGDLTIKNVTRQVALPVEFHGVIRDSVGQTRLGGSASLNINRLDYGVTWSQVLDNGSLVVDDDVQIELQFEAVRQEAEKNAAE